MFRSGFLSHRKAVSGAKTISRKIHPTMLGKNGQTASRSRELQHRAHSYRFWAQLAR
jgi:hypothetical protein